jgi:site-specific DNA-cytosine methylase
VAVAKLLWFVKSKRAQTSDDDETWLRGGVVPTLNAFDIGDTRATVIILMREREGKAGGGKGFLLAEDKAFTLATSNFHTVFILDGTRVGDVRVYQDSVMQTVIQRWGTGGGNVPMIFEPTSQAVAFDTFNQTVSDTNQTIKAHSANNENIGTVFESSVVRRLTPTECERLQGFPDGWTDGQSDAPRYKQMGNAVAVPVVEWIINRIIK